jgi:cytidine deaminase
VHAEQAALANAYMAGESAVVSIAVTAPPCGHCRQFLQEFSPDGEIRILLKGEPSRKLSKLLPVAFGPKDLGFRQGALPVRPVGMAMTKPSKDPLKLAALHAARTSYAPYTSSHSGVALLTVDGRIFAGSYIENAAFNPSLPPLQTALAGLFAAGANASGLARAVLVEVEGARISQVGNTRAVLSSIAPGVRLEIGK